MGPFVIPESDLLTIRELYDAGKYVKSWQHLQSLPPLAHWKQPAACTLAARLLNNLEAPRLAQSLHARAWRLHRGDPECTYYRARNIYHRLGPLRALRFVEQLPAFPDEAVELRAELLSLHSTILSRFRDTTRMERLWQDAVALLPGHPWLWVERAGSLEAVDRYDEALEAAQKALALRPGFRPGVQRTAHLLGLLDRDDEALALLRQGAIDLESPGVVAQLATLLVEHDQHEEALVFWRRYRELAVAIEPDHLEWWHARMSDALYETGKITQAGEHARCARNGFHDQIAERLIHPPAEARIVRLTLPFVRQHDMTCAPATLSAITRYWQTPVDHLALAREICYDGTQSHRERHWAEQKGFVTREFTVTWEAAVCLLDRGVPFAIGTVETRSAHLQAVMGYDGVRGTLILRDPYLKHPGEVIGPKWLKSYEPVGPRGLVLLPAGEAARLDGIHLPDAELYDHLHKLERAIYLHQRTSAEESLTALIRMAPGHRITFEARRAMAAYDRNQEASLASIEGLLALFPEHNGLRWARYHALEDLSRHKDRRILLGELARGKEAEPVFWRELAINLQSDARRLPEARRWLIRALHYQPSEAEHLHAIAGVLWDERRLEDALSLYRLAASLRDKVEYLQKSWFVAARHLRQHEDVLKVLFERARGEGARSSWPARTLYSALSMLNRDDEALSVLDEAIALRPEDGDLLCFAADSFARHAQPARAQELLSKAEGLCSQLSWWRTAATLADYRADSAEALRLNQAALLEAPLDLSLHENVARLLAETSGRSAAIAHLATQIERFPFHLGLRHHHIRWCRDEGAAACEGPLREFLALAPENVWGLRELALVLTDLHRTAEALSYCDQAILLTPKDESSHGIRAFVLLNAGRLLDAAEGARAALRLSIDYTAAYTTLLDSTTNHEGKQAALEFILRELESQVVFGDGLLEYRRHAFRILDGELLLTNLRTAHRLRPDLWHAWAALICQLCDMQRAPEALPIAQEAVERFPLSARLWSDLARVLRDLRDYPAEIAALQKASSLNPHWGFLSRQLAEALQRLERYEETCRVLEEAITAAPLDSENHVQLAEVLWRRGRDTRAIELLTHAIRLNPDSTGAWNDLQNLLPAGDNRLVLLARELTEKRGGEVAPWMRLAEVLPESELSERLAALDHVISLNPRYVEAYDLRAWLLADAGRYDDSLQACRPPVFGEHPPRSLRARAAWVVAQRGNIPSAIAAMQEVVAAEPDYYWAWECLARWHDQTGNHEGEREAAERMSRLAPSSAIPLGYLADAMKKLGKADEAVAILKRAFALDPSYGFAGYTIFSEALRQRNLPEAHATLLQLQQHLPGSYTIAAEARLAAAERDKAKSLNAVEKLFTASEQDSGALFSAAKALQEANWHVDLERAIWKRRNDPNMSAASGAVWVRSFTRRQKWRHRRKLKSLAPSVPFAQEAIREFVNACGETRRLDFLRQILRWHGHWLRSDDAAWGTVGYAYVACSRPKLAASWLKDWKSRTGTRPWMLQNVAFSLEELGQDDQALEVRRHALNMPRDHTSPMHLTRLALVQGLRGNLREARTLIQEIDYGQLEPKQQAEWAMVNTMAEVSDSAASERPNFLKGKRVAFYEQHPIVHTNPALRRLLRPFENSLAQSAGVKRARPIKTKGAGRGASHLGGVLAWVLIAALLVLSRCAPAKQSPKQADPRLERSQPKIERDSRP